MKKFSAMIVLMMASLSAYAGSSSQPKNAEDNHGIVTPEIASGMWRTYRHTNDDNNMNILICPKKMNHDTDMNGSNPTCKDKNGNNAWVRMENSIPQGTKFVGFKSVSQSSSQYIEIYWKQVKQ